MRNEIKITVVAGVDSIPNLQIMESDMQEGETIAFLVDGENRIFFFTMVENSEIFTSNYPENMGLSDMLNNHFELAGE